jgi:hypothetical protein
MAPHEEAEEAKKESTPMNFMPLADRHLARLVNTECLAIPTTSQQDIFFINTVADNRCAVHQKLRGIYTVHGRGCAPYGAVCEMPDTV